jgi:hypothetical protein
MAVEGRVEDGAITSGAQGKETARRRASWVPQPRLPHVHAHIPPLLPGATCTSSMGTDTVLMKLGQGWREGCGQSGQSSADGGRGVEE